jgi:hypothetical protein
MLFLLLVLGTFAGLYFYFSSGSNSTNPEEFSSEDSFETFEDAPQMVASEEVTQEIEQPVFQSATQVVATEVVAEASVEVAAEAVQSA